MAFSYDWGQSYLQSASTNAPSIPLTTGTLAGHAILVQFTIDDIVSTVSSVTDNAPGGSNVYIPVGVTFNFSTFRSSHWFIANNVTANASQITAHISAAVAFCTFDVWSVNPGVFGTILTFDTTASAFSLTPGTALSSASFNTAYANEIVLATAYPGASVTYTPGAGYTEDASNSGFLGPQHLTTPFATTQTGITATTTISGTGAIWALLTAAFGITQGISGNAGIPNATISYTGQASGSVTADIFGNYLIPQAAAGSYTITPSKSGVTFSPTSQGVTKIDANTGITANFTASTAISSVVFTVTDTTIVATWTTAGSGDSKIFAGAKSGLDNSLGISETSHFAVVTGLSPSTTYSCYIQTGASTSTPKNVTTGPATARFQVTSATNGSPTVTLGHGDTVFTAVSNDNVTYATMGDGWGFTGVDNAGANMQLGKYTNESTFVGADINLLSNFGGEASSTGQDGPGGVSSTYKPTGIISIAGNLIWPYSREDGFPYADYLAGLLLSPDKGATWSNWQNPLTFVANGLVPIPTGQVRASAPCVLANVNYGWLSPVMYDVDDGTLGYNTANNQIDGANGWVYFSFTDTTQTTSLYLVRVPRRSLSTITGMVFQYWIGPSSPTQSDFVNDSNWSMSDASKVAIFTGADATPYGCPKIHYIPILNSYMMTCATITSQSNTTWHFYSAPTPAGPWTLFFTQANNPSGYYRIFPFHRDTATNTAAQNLSVRILYNYDYLSTANYHPNVSTLTLITSAYPVSGNCGVGGATVAYSGTASGSVTADALGYYTIPGLANGSYTITPSKTGYTFSPVNSAQTVAGADITGVNFTATQLQVATPTFSPAAGTYTSAQTVTISSTDSALAGFAMYYTTDGTTPTTGSTHYTVPVSVSATGTLKAIAVATGYANSAIGSAAYVINLTPAVTVYSVPDCRKAPFGPNQSRTVQGTLIYDVQTSSNLAVPTPDSRKTAPADSRQAPNIPENSRTPGVNGPGE